MEFAPAIIEKLRQQAGRYRELTDMLGDPEIAADPKRMTGLLRERGSLEASAQLAAKLDELLTRRSEAEALAAEDDPEMRELVSAELETLDTEEAQFDHDAKAALVAEPDDERKKVIVEIRAGTGGDEATLFAADLFRIYQRYCDARRWKVEIFEQTSSEVGGFKEIIFAVDGADVWRRLQFESGGHRVQRVPTTETQGRIHTSAATVAVLPEAEEVDLEIASDDLRIETMRASGAGGQHVNKTESAVRITHIPTNTVVVCMDEKSQHKNRATAMRILRTRILDAERARAHAERAALRKSQVGTGDRNARVRTYNWPQNRVTDHRLGQNFSLEHILAGKLDPLLEGLESQDREERIRNL